MVVVMGTEAVVLRQAVGSKPGARLRTKEGGTLLRTKAGMVWEHLMVRPRRNMAAAGTGMLLTLLSGPTEFAFLT